MKRLPLVAAVTLALAFVGSALVAQDYLQNAQFRVAWKDESMGKFANPAAWSSDQGVLYWLEDQQETEALVNIRERDGLWRLELAVTTERQSILFAVHSDTEAMWAVRTGLAQDVVPGYEGDYPESAVVCMIPRGARRNAWRCYWGTALLLNDAWDEDGQIPAKYFEPYAKCQGLFESLVALGQPDVPTYGGRPASQCPPASASPTLPAGWIEPEQ